MTAIKITGILLIIVGLISLTGGILLVARGNSASIVPQRDAQQVFENSKNLTDINKEKGTSFEAYVARKFNSPYFKTKEWRGDKFTNGIHVESTLYPDLQIEFDGKGVTEEFAVECKYRANYYRDGVELRDDQLSNYRGFQYD